MKRVFIISSGVAGLVILFTLSLFGPIEIERKVAISDRLPLVPIDKDTTFVRFDHRRIDRIILISEQSENEENKHLGLFFPVRYTEDKQLIEKFCATFRMKVRRADIATITSDIHVYHRDTLVYSGNLIMDLKNNRVDLQDSYYGATELKFSTDVVDILDEFSVYFWPVLWTPEDSYFMDISMVR